MVLSNFVKMLGRMLSGIAINWAESYRQIGLMDVNGKSVGMLYCSYGDSDTRNSLKNISLLDSTTLIAMCGQGDAAPTPDDYKLEQYNENIKHSDVNPVSTTYRIEGNSTIFTLLLSVTNASTETVMVKEFGVARKMYGNSGGTVLLTREVLGDKSFALAPHQSAKIIYEIEI